RKLPPIGFSIDYSGTAMTAERFPASDCYLKLSRPPGGSLEFVVKSYRSETHNHSALKYLIQDFASDIGLPVKMGKTSTIRIGKIDRRSREFVAGRGLSRKKWVAAIIPSPDGGPYGLLAIFGLYIGSNGIGKDVSFSENQVFSQLMSGFELMGSS
ncbi:MAG: hypothetical protein ACFFAY_14995, partial [Promethearchaeota archaeon]